MEDAVPFNPRKPGEDDDTEHEDINRNTLSTAARFNNRKKDSNEDSTVIAFPSQRQLMRTRPQEVSPIDEKTCFDLIISCGFGARSYTLGPKFASPRFRVKFASKLYYVLLVQLLICILWMSYVPSSTNFSQLDDITRGIVVTAIIFYVLIFIITRFSSCEGMCLLGHMIITITMTICMALAFGGLVLFFPSWIFVVTALWCTLVLLAVTNCTKWANVLTTNAYIVAAAGSLVSSAVLVTSGWCLSVPAIIAPAALYEYTTAIFLLTPLLSLFIVHEVKKLIGGRRADLEGHEWILAAVII